VAIREHAAGDLAADRGYLGVARSEHPMFVEITLRRGRPTEKKQALYREIARRMSATGLVRTEDLLIVLHENDTADWSFGDGVAQYVEAEQRQGRE
jgi:phenylpyruvate tautomerase PptA (4-oxalocrotonate tautomerase family)